MESRLAWHMDPKQLRTIISSVVAALAVQFVGVVLFAFITLDRLNIWKDNVDKRLDGHEVQLVAITAANEKLARMDEVVKRLERVVDRLEAERRR